jgi:acyl CoA:acetate/3-ketoacid CoA transferase beta subunit
MIPNGATVTVGGFMGVGTPERLLDELVRQRKSELFIISNDAAVDLVVTDMAVIGFSGGRTTLQEIAPGVTVAEVMAEADLFIPANAPPASPI